VFATFDEEESCGTRDGEGWFDLGTLDLLLEDESLAQLVRR
jgi:hypothetical protein